MAFSSLARSRLSSSFLRRLRFSSNTSTTKKPAQSATIQGPKFHSGRICGFTSNPTLLNNLASKRAHSNSCFGHTQKKFYHGQGFNYTKTLQHYLISKGNWGFWVWKHRVSVTIAGSCILISLCFGHWETIPYSKRKHFVPLTDKFDIWLSNNQFDNCKIQYKGLILPRENPISERIFKISRDMTSALRKDLEMEKGSMALSYASASSPTKKKLKRPKKGWIVRRGGRKLGKHHLDGMHWEVVVVDKPHVVNAFCLPNGKIVVFTGLLEVCKSDDELATVIGHEVGHVVARHVSERLMRIVWFLTMLGILSQFIPSEYGEAYNKLIKSVQKFLIEYPLSRRREAEADHIGLMLMASAGYDPQKAPNVYKKLESGTNEFLSTHPSGKKRAEMLSRKEMMQEAVAVYNKVKAPHSDFSFM